MAAQKTRGATEFDSGRRAREERPGLCRESDGPGGYRVEHDRLGAPARFSQRDFDHCGGQPVWVMFQSAANGYRRIRRRSANCLAQVVQGFERYLAPAALSVDKYLATLPAITDIVERRGKYTVANLAS